MSSILELIHEPNAIKKISQEDYKKLAAEIRRFLVTNVSRTGGHLASNLGVVELTMALHLYLKFPDDKLIWDVGHQSYVHKILTGRKGLFDTLRQKDGLSGFPKRKESPCDAFDTGHSSTSISIANGIAKARDLNHENYRVAAVIGDGALTGGMAYEALNNISRMKTNVMIVLNDNEMSISENVGGMANYLGRLRTNTGYQNFKDSLETMLHKIPIVGTPFVEKLRKSKASLKQFIIPGMLFEEMGLTYIGPINGHSIKDILTAFASASKVKGPVIVHVITKKGKGYKKAEQDPSRFHGIAPFDCSTGNSKGEQQTTYTEVFSETMLALAEKNEKLIAITAAMECGTGLETFAEKYHKRCFDVGIAEEHAVTFAAGLAAAGYHPVAAIYSSFLQRAYDQILHDVCIGNLPVTFAVDRSGIVGNDGETHQGVFDTSFLTHIPNLAVLTPKNGIELKEMIRFAVDYEGPMAVKYPRGAVLHEFTDIQEPIVFGKSEWIQKGSEIAVLFVGNMADMAHTIYHKLKAYGKNATIINVRFLSPIDEEMLLQIGRTHEIVITMEENIKRGGFGERAAAFYMENQITNIQFYNISLPDTFITQGTKEELRIRYGIGADSIMHKIIENMNCMCTETCG